ncbi:hypothetical protein GT037_001507 [Alternaria burnsii]|uniref:Uncharacterized protein n=1 Tax=Alternaria burnsii TaxID=1187904 RepID=A0A8H7BHZ8_9PLEO|nr:uncharacterized protein GT037_001507 [Alternaria burnsii]KAF7679856.1 hypothetical protein GT037_001507 [Alternaria burnsii]CAI9629176.1 unnamed protein product [Alternaria burnsii]
MHKRAKRSARRPNSTPLPSPQVLDLQPSGTQPIIRQGREAVVYHIPISTPSLSPPSSPTLSPYKTTISLPRHSAWTSGLHFHTTHTEYLRLLRGAIFIYIDGETQILSAKADGSVAMYRDKTAMNERPGLQVKVNKYARHNWGRAREYLSRNRRMGVVPRYPEDMDDEVVVEEWTEPVDLVKPLFFWNLNAVVLAPLDARLEGRRKKAARWVLGGWWVSFQLFTIFHELDNWPVLVGLRGVLGGETDSPRVGRWNRKIEGAVEWCIIMTVVGFARAVGWVLGVKAVEKERTPEGLWEGYQKNRAWKQG